MAGGFLPEGFLPTGHLPDGYLPEVEGAGTASPIQFHFETVFRAERATQYESNAVVIAGLSEPSSCVVANGEQSVNGGAFSSDPVIVSNGDELQVRQTSSAAADTQKATTATIGSTVGTFVTVTSSAEVFRARWNRRAIVPFRRRVA